MISVLTERAVPLDKLISSAIFFNLLKFLEAKTILKFSLANLKDNDFPIPEEAPVMMTVFLKILKTDIVILLRCHFLRQIYFEDRALILVLGLVAYWFQIRYLVKSLF